MLRRILIDRCNEASACEGVRVADGALPLANLA
jgi:hypothetical protein